MPVVLPGPGAVRADVGDVPGRQSGLPQCVGDGQPHLQAVGAQPGHVVPVAAAGVAGHLAVDVRAPSRGVSGLLQHQHRRPLGQHEAVPVGVEGAGGVRRVVVVRAGGLDGVERGDGDRRDRRVGGTGEHDVGLAVDDQLVGVADGVDAGGAAGGDDLGRPVQAVAAGHVRGQAAGHQRRVEVRAAESRVDQPTPAAVAHRHVLLFQCHGAADGGAQDTPVRSRSASVSSSPLSRPPRRAGQRELHVPVGALPLGGGQPGGVRVEVALGGDLRPERRRVEEGDPPGGRTPLGDALPEPSRVTPPGATTPTPVTTVRRVVTTGPAARQARCRRGRVPGAAPAARGGRRPRRHVPVLRSRCRTLRATNSASPAASGTGSSSRSTVMAPRAT